MNAFSSRNHFYEAVLNGFVKGSTALKQDRQKGPSQ